MSLYWGRLPHNHTEEASRPHGGYLWTRAFEAGISVRNYGWMTKQSAEAKTGEKQILDAESKQLLAATNPYFRGFDVSYPDIDRMRFFLDDLKEFERKGEMPRLIVMRLGNDHTAGMTAGAITPRAMFADNDLALGRLVEAVSKSRFWKQTAIFVLEDDAQIRVRPRGFAPLACVRDLAVCQAASSRPQHVQHGLDVADHRTDPRPAAHDAFRRRRAAHVQRIHRPAGPRAVYRRGAAHFADGAQPGRHRAGRRVPRGSISGKPT